MKKFPCTSCGECCRVGPHSLGWHHKDGTPYEENEACEFLEPDNSCRIYEMRPPACSVRDVYVRRGLGLITWDEFMLFNAKVCDVLILDGIKEGRLSVMQDNPIYALTVNGRAAKPTKRLAASVR